MFVGRHGPDSSGNPERMNIAFHVGMGGLHSVEN